MDLFTDLPEGFEQISIPDKPAKGAWSIDIEQVAKATQLLGIELPIKIRYQGKGIFTAGTHYIRPYMHFVALLQTLPLDKANKTLWHELAHAMQAERWSRETGRDICSHYREEYKVASGSWGFSYGGNRLEIEANGIAKAQSHWKLLYGDYYASSS